MGLVGARWSQFTAKTRPSDQCLSVTMRERTTPNDEMRHVGYWSFTFKSSQG
jgi:hypothetical protein